MESVKERPVNGEQTGRHLLTLLRSDLPTERVNLLSTTSSWVETETDGVGLGGRPYVIEVTLEVPENLSGLIFVADELSVI